MNLSLAQLAESPDSLYPYGGQYMHILCMYVYWATHCRGSSPIYAPHELGALP